MHSVSSSVVSKARVMLLSFPNEEDTDRWYLWGQGKPDMACGGFFSCEMSPVGDLMCPLRGLLVFHSWSVEGIHSLEEGTWRICFEMSR